MKEFLKNILFLLCLLSTIISCDNSPAELEQVFLTKEKFEYYISKGNEEYSKKAGLPAIVASQLFFDTAAVIANELNDSILIARSIFAKGKIYDAWNKEPIKTIEYYEKASEMYGRIDSMRMTQLYIKQLLAHSYGKIKDSLNCIRVLNDLYAEIKTHSVKERMTMKFIPEMALISTEVGNYPLAEKILDELVDEKKVRNEPGTNNYRDHYFLTRSRLEVFGKQERPFRYLDSLENTFANAPNSYDSLYYSEQLFQLYDALGDIPNSYTYLKQNVLNYAYVNNKVEFDTISNRLANMEAKTKKQKSIILKRLNQIWIITFIGLGILAIGSVFMSIVFRRSSNKYFRIWKELEISNQKTTLLYKELHHRIKNNLHMIFSLLQMQERKSDNPATIENLKAARLRIESIAVMHEEMMLQEDFVDFKRFLHRLVSSITECFSFERRIITHLNIDNTQVPQKQSFSLALIINEWISNSIKHAETNNLTLELFIDIIDKNDHILIKYSDNGFVDSKAQRIYGLGSQIIQLLSKQLNASIENNPNQPYHYTIKINKT